MSRGYHDNEALQAEAEALASNGGTRAEVLEPGKTVSGLAIRGVRVAAPGRRPSAERPQALVTANLHGNEVIGSEVALELLRLLVAAAPEAPGRTLLDQADVTVLPAVNLDSRAVAAAALVSGRLGRRAPRGNGHGVDLNRNFPHPADSRDAWHPLSGTGRRWLPWYRGPEAMSEPETRAICDLAETLRPVAAVNLHSVGRLFLHPYCCSPEPPPDIETFVAMGDAFAAAQRVRPYRVKQSRAWYTILGDMDDWLYDRFGTLSVTVELAGPLEGWSPLEALRPLAWMNPRDPAPTCRHTAAACLAALAHAAACRADDGREGDKGLR